MDLFYSYLAGLYTADGWKQGDHRFGWETKDEPWIKKISEILNVPYVHRERVVKTGAHCNIYGLQTLLPEFLIKNDSGYKNFKEWFLKASSEERDSYVKGFFDGDGSVCYYKGTKRVRIIFYTVETFTYDIIIDYLNSLKIQYSIYCDKRGHEVIQISVGRTRDIFKLYTHWYGEVYLDRKYQLMKESLMQQDVYEVCGPKDIRYFINREDIVKNYPISNPSITDCITGKVPACHGYEIRKISLEQSGFPTQVIEY